MARTRVERNISFDTQRGVYYVCLDEGREGNKRQKHYRTAPTLRAARAELLDFEREREARRAALPMEPGRTLDSWLREWLTTVIRPTRAETTAYAYRNIIRNHIRPALGKLPLEQVTPQVIQRYYAALLREKHLSPNTVRRHHDLLSCALGCAVRQDLLSDNPLRRVEPPQARQPQTRFYTADQLRRLYDLVEGTPLEVPVKLAGGLGLRREEICGLRWQNVDLDRRRVCICQARTCVGSRVVEKGTKNASSLRTLSLTGELCDLLRRERQRQEEAARRMKKNWPNTGLVYVGRYGVPPKPNTLTRAFSQFIRKNDLPYLTLHGLRHTFATLANQQGAPLFDIGKALGHSTPSTTGKIYTHLVDQTHAATLDLVARAVR